MPWGQADPCRLSDPTRDPSEAARANDGVRRASPPAARTRPGPRPAEVFAPGSNRRLRWTGFPPERRPAARVQARDLSPRLWLPARAPRSPRSAGARLSAVFAFAFLPLLLRKMKVTVAVARAGAAAVGARDAQNGGGRRGAWELEPLPAPDEMAALPGLVCTASSPEAGQQGDKKMDSPLQPAMCQGLQPIGGKQHQEYAAKTLRFVDRTSLWPKYLVSTSSFSASSHPHPTASLRLRLEPLGPPEGASVPELLGECLGVLRS
ncbi:uncharacterized protein LOC131519224 [Neofelis nebulosa]|uniref:uncharacterized protein LOC131519224 n=1 Tax=Neofelis nebulosa TaxID=61452 RepID=UPI00272D98A6|nr:uncharacterized protein LOC131519224 [Neofelis nebulosa]